MMTRIYQTLNCLLDAWIEARKLQAEDYIKNNRRYW
jgi:hypothetical protein